MLTIEALHSHAGGNLRLEVYNSQKMLLRAADGVSGVERIDVNAGAGSVYLVRIVGSNSDVDLRITNLVTMNRVSATVHGTGANDTFVFDASGSQRQIVINGTTYAIGTATQVTFNGNGGTDSATLIGGAVADKATLRGGRGQMNSSAYQVSAQAEYVTAQGGAGDIVFLHEPVVGSQWGNDPTGSWVTGGGNRSTASGFSVIAKISKATAFSAASIPSAGAVGDSELFAPLFASAMNGSNPLTQNAKSLSVDFTVQAATLASGIPSVGDHTPTEVLKDLALVEAEESLVSLPSAERAKDDLGVLEAVFHQIGRAT